MNFKNIVLLLICGLNMSLLMSQKKVAVLPFVFSDDGHISIDKGKEAQEFLIDYFNKKSKHIHITTLNARDINVTLKKAGITAETIDNFTTSEIAQAIGNPDFILMGSIHRSFDGITQLESGFSSINDANWNKTNVYSASSSSSTKKYSASVSVSIFTAKGNAVYEKSKGNIFIDTMPDSWKNSLIWHVRHFPFYD